MRTLSAISPAAEPVEARADMSDQNLHQDDVSAMRRQGDLRSYLRQTVAAGQTRQRANLKPAVRIAAPVAGHIPGAWPIGVNAAISPDHPPVQGKVCPCVRCAAHADDAPAATA